MWAIKKNQKSCLQQLIAAGANLEAKDNVSE